MKYRFKDFLNGATFEAELYGFMKKGVDMDKSLYLQMHQKGNDGHGNHRRSFRPDVVVYNKHNSNCVTKASLKILKGTPRTANCSSAKMWAVTRRIHGCRMRAKWFSLCYSTTAALR